MANVLWNFYRAGVGEAIPFPEDARRAFQMTAMWITDQLTNAPHRSQWLHIQGDIGTGKTTLARAVNQTLWAMSGCSRATWSMPATSAVAYYQEGDPDGKYNTTRKCTDTVFIDDIGTEPLEVVVYGNVMQPIVEIFLYRYNEGLPMIYTTNLDGKALGAKYGERVLDRMREEAMVITLTGESWRRKKSECSHQSKRNG